MVRTLMLAVGVVVAGVVCAASTPGLAQSLSDRMSRSRGLVDFLFGQEETGSLPAAPAAAPADRVMDAVPSTPAQRAPARPVYRSMSMVDLSQQPRPAQPTVPAERLKITITPSGRMPATAGGGAYCVRTCDGFFFPVSEDRSSPRASAASLCQAMCPSADTRVFRLPGGSDSFDNAVDESDGRPYSSLKTAFAYRNAVAPACSCRPAGASTSALSYLEDTTLRAGDFVVTPKGVRMFAGAASFPFTDRDFKDFREGRNLSRETTAYLAAVDRLHRRAGGVAKPASGQASPLPPERPRIISRGVTVPLRAERPRDVVIQRR